MIRHSVPKRNAFTLVELLVVIAVIGILVGLLLPAVQSAREAARRMQCQNNLHQIALATHMFHDTRRVFPPARYQPRPGAPTDQACGGSETTWLVRILPYMEQGVAERNWDYSIPYADHPDEVRGRPVSTYCCPSRRSVSDAIGSGLVSATTTTFMTLPCGCKIPVTAAGSVTVSGALGDYGGNHGDLSPGSSGLPTDFYYGGNGTGVIISSRARCNGTSPVDWIDRVGMKDLVDGTSTTMLAGEMHVPLGKLGKSPEDAFIFNGDNVFSLARLGGPTVPISADPRAEGNALVGFGSWHSGICNFAVSDGSVRSVTATIDTDTLGRLCNRNDGRPVSLED